MSYSNARFFHSGILPGELFPEELFPEELFPEELFPEELFSPEGQELYVGFGEFLLAISPRHLFNFYTTDTPEEPKIKPILCRSDNYPYTTTQSIELILSLSAKFNAQQIRKPSIHNESL